MRPEVTLLIAAGADDVLVGGPLEGREDAAGVWRRWDTKSNYLHVFMIALRRPFEPDPADRRDSTTQPGVGLRFVPDGVPFP